MKLQASNFVVRKPKTVDITAFFKKFCIATRTIMEKTLEVLELSSVFPYKERGIKTMKKWIALLLAAVLCLSLAACGSSNGGTPVGDEQAANHASARQDAAAETTPAISWE